MKQFFRTTLLLALVAALALASLPLVSVSAAGEYDPPTPQGEVPNEQLEQVWARQLRRYERLSHTEDFIEKVQNRIDRARANGKDVSALQAALDAFAARVKEAQPVYESMKGIINSHPGFGEHGNVTDPDKARETVKAMQIGRASCRERV